MCPLGEGRIWDQLWLGQLLPLDQTPVAPAQPGLSMGMAGARDTHPCDRNLSELSDGLSPTSNHSRRW